MNQREEQFTTLVRENHARLWGIARAYGDRGGGAEDIYQNILLQIWRSLPDFRGEAEVGTWLYRVALNTALQARRRGTATAGTVSMDELPESGNWLTDPMPGPDERADTDKRLQRLLSLIQSLGDLDRALIVLHLEGTPYRMMANVLGISQSNVGARLHRVRNQLSRRMQEETA